MPPFVQAIRRQFSLYVPSESSREIEAVRRVLDPVQRGLISTHVTLCREGELETVAEPELLRRLMSARFQAIKRMHGFS